MSKTETRSRKQEGSQIGKEVVGNRERRAGKSAERRSWKTLRWETVWTEGREEKGMLRKNRSRKKANTRGPSLARR